MRDQLLAPHPAALGVMCFGWSPATSPTAEVAGKGDGEGQRTGRKGQEDFCGDSGTSQPDRLACRGPVVSEMALVDVFMTRPSSFILASCKEIFEKVLGTKSYTWVIYLYEMMSINRFNRYNGSNAPNAYQTHK